MVTRLENWPVRFSGYLKSRREMPFEWGKHDCMTFVSGAVAAITGYDFLDEYLPYSDEKTAKEMLEEYGGLRGIITEHLGHSGHSNVLVAQRGDVVISKLETSPGIFQIVSGIIDDSGKNVCAVTDKGFSKYPLNTVLRIWSY